MTVISSLSVDRKLLKVNETIKVSGDAFGLCVTTIGDRSIYLSGTEVLER
ncbi:MAG: hypothetical protein V7L27_16860 [Nostoc sp.]